MAQARSSSIRLFRFAGIEVFLHWSWALIAFFEIQNRRNQYSSLFWNISEYLALFVIVLLHEFGHALACKQVGGVANRIMLWPLGGVAYVSPPPRPGAMLWSIAAGPLVNVILGILLTAGLYGAAQAGLAATLPDAYGLLRSVWYINLGLLIFNMLPIYPLDGGQILRSLLWYIFGESKSLLISSWLGILGGLGVIALALYVRSVWLVIIAVFLLLQCRRGIAVSGALTALQNAPRHEGFECPSCKRPPLVGEMWACPTCKTRFDTFLSAASCPGCGATFPATSCPHCKTASAFESWRK